MVDLIVFLKVVALIITIMIIWFNSGAFTAYCKALSLKKLLFGYDKNSDGLTFTQYLYVKRNIIFKCPACLFLVELITCPLCLGVWLSIFCTSIFLSYTLIPVVYLVVLVIYFLINRIIN